MLLFMVLLLKQPPDLDLDFWHIKSKKPLPSYKPLLLHGHKYCIFSTTQSIHSNDYIKYPFTDTFQAQSTYVANYSMTILPFPTMPSHLKT